jgi:hypothetical protein
MQQSQLNERIQKIDWESAKKDMWAFITDPSQLDIWSPKFFSDLVKHIEVENKHNINWEKV